MGDVLALDMRIGRPPDRRAGHALEQFEPGPRRAPDAVQQRECDADRHPLFDRQHNDRPGGGRHHEEFGEVLAAVCHNTTRAIKRLKGTSRAHCSSAITGSDGAGSTPDTVPTTFTPLLSRLARITMAVAPTRPISAPGIRALRVSEIATTASTPKPMPSVSASASPI